MPADQWFVKHRFGSLPSNCGCGRRVLATSAMGQERSYDLCLRNRPFVAHRACKIAYMRDEALDHRIERSILERHDDDRTRPSGQIDGQHFDRPPVRAEAQDRRPKGDDEMAGNKHGDPQLRLKGHHADVRHPQSTHSKRLFHAALVLTVRPFRQDPRFVHERGEWRTAGRRSAGIAFGTQRVLSRSN
jgi:hypothetical protein